MTTPCPLCDGTGFKDYAGFAMDPCDCTGPALAGDAPRGLGRAMAGSGKAKRQNLDYYPTPADVSRALIRAERHCIASFAAPVWEPCGRGGAILRVLAAEGFQTIGTDIVADPESGVEPLDVLAASRARSPVVVTNPPFALAAPIITHLLGRLKVDYLALLLKASFWHADERRTLFRAHRPARIHALNWRPDFLGGGAPTMECSWVVWQRGWALGTHYDLLAREPETQAALL